MESIQRKTNVTHGKEIVKFIASAMVFRFEGSGHYHYFAMNLFIFIFYGVHMSLQIIVKRKQSRR